MNAGTMFELPGKIAVVTGGKGLYGSAISEGLCEAGAHVIIASRDGESCEAFASGLRNAGGSAEGRALDLGDDASVKALAEYAENRFGGADILVNNAVTREYYGLPEDMERDQVLRSLDINIAGMVLLTKYIINGMKKRGAGSIINIASIQGVMGPHFPYYEPGQTSPLGYTLEKWGMVGLTKWLAAYYGKDGIRVNCLSPGGYDPKLAETRPDFYRRYAEHTPLGKWPDRDDIKGPVVFLASEASRYVTGINLLMDGGFTIW
jgi:NAD(P)-dependent dehydrogenase (short-subunit alcohol dehydrogenase family)